MVITNTLIERCRRRCLCSQGQQIKGRFYRTLHRTSSRLPFGCISMGRRKTLCHISTKGIAGFVMRLNEEIIKEILNKRGITEDKDIGKNSCQINPQ